MRPVEVEQLIEDLRAEKTPSNVAVQPDSQMVVLTEDDEQRYVFDASECRSLLASSSAVQRLFEALDYPEGAMVELHDLVIEPEVMSELESMASTVDEM